MRRAFMGLGRHAHHLAQLFEEVRLGVQASGGVEDDQVRAARDARLDGVERHCGGIRAGGAADEARHAAVDVAAFNRAADDEVVRAPAMVGAVAVGVKRAAEVRGRERRDLFRGAQFDGGVVKGREATGNVGEDVRVGSRHGVAGVDLRIMEVEAADAGKEDLALEPELGCGGDEAGDGAELLAEAGRGERGGEGHRSGKDAGHKGAVGDGVGGESGKRGFEKVLVLRGEQVVLGLRADVLEAGADRGSGTGDGDGARGADGVLGDLRARADLERVLAVQGDRHRDRVV